MTLHSATKTAQDVAIYVKRQFGDESGVQLTDVDLIRWINDGQAEINRKNAVLKAKAVADSVAGQSDYSLPTSGASGIESIHYSGIPLRALSYVEAELFIQNSDPEQLQSGTPEVWYEWAGLITLWPEPDSTLVGAIAILYVREPTAILVISDTLTLPDRYFSSLVKYVTAAAYEMDEDWTASDFKTKQLSQDLDVMADDERTTSTMTYPVIVDTGLY